MKLVLAIQYGIEKADNNGAHKIEVDKVKSTIDFTASGRQKNIKHILKVVKKRSVSVEIIE